MKNNSLTFPDLTFRPRFLLSLTFPDYPENDTILPDFPVCINPVMAIRAVTPNHSFANLNELLLNELSCQPALVS